MKVKANKTFKVQLFFWLLALSSFLLPFSNRFFVLAIGLTTLAWITTGNFNQKIERTKGNVLFWLFIGFYLANIIGTLVSNNLANGIFDLEVKLSLLLMPFILATCDRFNGKQLKILLGAFVVGCLTMVIASVGYAFVEHSGGHENAFFYSYLSKPWSINIIYYAMLCNFAIAIVIYLLYTNWYKLNWLWRIAGIVVGLLFYFFVYLAAARMQILILLAMLTFFFGFVLLKRKKYLYAIILAVVINIVGFGLLKQMKAFDRFTTLQKINDKDDSKTDNNRLRMWQSALDLIKAKPFGYGNGDMQDQLNLQYDKKDFDDLLAKRLNPHNQYLEVTLAIGILGLIIFLLGMIIPTIMSFWQKQLLYLAFLIIIGFSMLTESILQKQTGVTFFAFFNSLLAFHLLKPLLVNQKDASSADDQ